MLDEIDERIIYEYNDELYMIEQIYKYKQRQENGTLREDTMIKIKCIDPMPCHVPIDVFKDKYKAYDPNEE